MPRLPGAEDIRRDIPQSGRGIVSVDLSAPAEAMAKSGEATMRVAARLSRMDEAKAKDKADLQISYGKSHFLQGQAALQNELAQDNDYTTYSPRYTEKLTKLHAESIAMVEDPAEREKFAAQLQTDVIRGIGTVQELGRHKQADAGVASLNETLDRNTNASATATGGQWDALQAASIGSVDAAHRNGYITATQAQAQIIATRERFATNRLQQEFDADPVGTLKKLAGGAVPSEGGFDAAYPVVAENEGGYVAQDGSSGAPANFGINQRAHPDVDVKNLTPDAAREIIRQEYWDAYDVGELPADVQAIVLDGVVNHGSAFKNKMLDEARDGATPNELIAMRRKEYIRLATADPKKYAVSLPGWEARLDRLSGNDTNYIRNIPPEKIEQFRQKGQAYIGKEVQKRASEIEQAAKLGLTVPHENIQQTAEMAQEAGLADIADAVMRYGDVQNMAHNFALQGTEHQVKTLELIGKEIEGGNLKQADLYAAYQNVLQNKQKMLGDNPWGWYAAQETVAQPQELDFNNPDTIAGEIDRRRADVLLVSKIEGGKVVLPVLTSGEIDQLKNVFDTGTPEQSASMLQTVGANLNGDERRGLAYAISKKSPMLAIAMSQSKPETAERIIAGKGLKSTLTQANFNTSFNTEMAGRVFDPIQMQNMKDAAYAYYKATELQKNALSDSVNSDIMEQTINDVVGKPVDIRIGFRGQESRIISFDADDGHTLDENEMDDLLSGITDDKLRSMNGALPVTMDRMSVDAEEIKSRWAFYNIGDGVYGLQHPDRGFLIDRNTGKPYAIDGRKLLNGKH